MALEIVCKACGATYVPIRSDLIKGPVIYRLCPACRPPAAGFAVKVAALKG